MPILKNYTKFTGLNLRSSILDQNALSARDSENTDINEKGSLIRRFGAITAEGLSSLDVSGVSTYTRLDGLQVPVFIRGNDFLVGDAETGNMGFNAANAPISTFFANSITNNLHEQQGASFATLNGNLYIATGYDPLYRYDGFQIGQASVPSKEIDSITVTGGASGQWVSNGDVSYRTTYTYLTGNGQITESDYSSIETEIGSKLASEIYRVIVPTIQQSEGYSVKSTSDPIALGGNNYIDILNAEASKWNDGEWLYLMKTSITGSKHSPLLFQIQNVGASGSGFSAPYTRLTLTTTIDSVVSFGASDFITNAYITIYRRIENNPFIIAGYAPNDVDVSTVTFRDDTDGSTAFDHVSFNYDTSLIPDPPDFGLAVDPVNKGIAPVASFITTFRDQLVLAGDPDNPGTVYFSDINDAEAFSATNSFRPSPAPGAKITGLAVFRDNLYVFTKNSIYIVSGDLDVTLGFRVDRMGGGEVGALSHQSIQNTPAGLMFLADRGVYRIVDPSVAPEEIGFNINTIFTDRSITFTREYANGAYVTTLNKYFLNYDQDNILVYDIDTNSWHKWTRLSDDSYIIAANTKTLFSIDVGNNIMLDLKISDGTSDRNDNGVAIPWSYTTGWEDVGSSSQFKKFLRLRLYGQPDGNDTSRVITMENYYDYDAVNTAASIQLTLNDINTFPFDAKTKLPSRKARAYSIKIGNGDINKLVEIAGIEVEIQTPYRERIKE